VVKAALKRNYAHPHALMAMVYKVFSRNSKTQEFSENSALQIKILVKSGIEFEMTEGIKQRKWEFLFYSKQKNSALDSGVRKFHEVSELAKKLGEKLGYVHDF
jgi:hypothetical protein